MTPGEFREIVMTMKEFGVSYVKMGKLELTMGPGSLGAQAPTSSSHSPGHGGSTPPPVVFPLETANLPDPIKHKVEEVTSLLKLGDIDLVNRLFPEPTEESA